jgi:hypothetical protein
VAKVTSSDRLSEGTWIALLELNHTEVRGVRRLDQQLIYVPLAAIAAAITAVAGNRAAYQNVGAILPLLVILPAIAAFVGLGLWRNNVRHRDLLHRRDAILRGLGQPPVRLDWAFRVARWLYYLLFLGGWIVGSWVLIRLL